MRAALWLMALFAIAVVSALFAGNNHGTVTLYLHPHRIDVSLNLVLLVIAVVFVLLHLAWRAVTALLRIPQQARSWRQMQQERAMVTAMLDALSHLVSGRFVRARKTAELVVALEESLHRHGDALAHAARLRTIAHLLAAESAHALQDKVVRDQHFQLALENASTRDAQEARDGVLLRGARWAFDDRDAGAAFQWLDQLPGGASRRTAALRLRFKVARLAGRSQVALETVRLLTKHRAFSEMAGDSIARGLALELLRAAHDPAQIQRAWDALDVSERKMPDVAIFAADRLLAHGGDVVLSRQWLLPVWDAMAKRPDAMSGVQRMGLVRALEAGFATAGVAVDAAWLSRIETAQMANPRDPVLQYLAGIACMHLQVWGKAQQMLRQSLSMLQDPDLRRDIWRALARMAEQRGDDVAAGQAYREAAKR